MCFVTLHHWYMQTRGFLWKQSRPFVWRAVCGSLPPQTPVRAVFGAEGPQGFLSGASSALPLPLHWWAGLLQRHGDLRHLGQGAQTVLTDRDGDGGRCRWVQEGGGLRSLAPLSGCGGEPPTLCSCHCKQRWTVEGDLYHLTLQDDLLHTD